MAAWRLRIARASNGTLHFVYARYRPDDPGFRCGLISSIPNAGTSVEEMRSLAMQLLKACDEPIITMAEREQESEPDDDDGEGIDDDT
jgi:hypothetical protein